LFKFLSFILGLLMSVTLVACGGSDSVIEYELNTDETDQLTLNRSYEGTTLENDGIEEVSLISCEDGDTAVFDSVNGQIRVRFLGIDTPEASYKYDPWGFQATQFTCEKLYEASTLVIEQDDAAGPVDNYGRTLGYVWYDGRLLNLEVLEQAYSLAVGVEKLKYADAFLAAQEHASLTNQRVYGEEDPLYDYSTSGTDMTIEEIVKNYEDNILKSVNVEGVITRKLGSHVYIEKDGYGVFVYTGYETSAKLAVGNEVRFEKMQIIYDLRRQGGLHLVRFNVRTVSLLSENNPVVPTTMLISEITDYDLGKFVRFEEMEITEIESYGDTWKITVNQNGIELQVIQPYAVLEEKRFDSDKFTIGQTIDLQGILQETVDGVQLLVLDSNDVTIDE
jgi:micrococcal nuclease